MKKVSKKTHQQLQKNAFFKPVSFQKSQIITQGGHFVKPSSHASFANEKLQILCKGYGNHAPEIAIQVLNFFKEPMLTLVNSESMINKESEDLLGNEMTEESKQRYLILNLIDSCLEELSSKGLEGSCSFGMCYIVNNTFFIVKNQLIECYSIHKKQRDNFEFKTIGSHKIPFQINSIPSTFGSQEGISNCQQTASKQTSGFFSCNPNYENIIAAKYFPEVSFLSMEIKKGEYCTVLMGNSECFCTFAEQELIEYLQEGDTLKQVGQKIIEVSKKRWKTIYQEDMTVIACLMG